MTPPKSHDFAAPDEDWVDDAEEAEAVEEIELDEVELEVVEVDEEELEKILETEIGGTEEA